MTALRDQLAERNAETKLYWGYNSFDIELFKADVERNLKSNNTIDISDFQNMFFTVIQKHAPSKKKTLRFNNSSKS